MAGMTSRSAPDSPGPRGWVSRPRDAAPAAVPPRDPASFPRAGEADVPRIRWHGGDGELAALLADHATAAGLRVTTGGDEVVAELAEAAGLTELHLPEGSAPLVVLAPDGPVPDRSWDAALRLGALALLRLPSESEVLLGLLADLARPRDRALVIGVAGGCGGAGASSLAARLTAAARAQGPVTLVDADPLGGGLDVLVEEPWHGGLGWDEAAALGAEDAEALGRGLPRVDEVALLVAGRGAGADAERLARVLPALAARGGTVVVDLAVELVPAARPELDRLLLVVPGTDHAVAAARRRLGAWRLPAGLAEVVVRRGGPLAPREVAEDLALSLAGAFRDSAPGVVPLLDVQRGGADRCCRALLREARGGDRP